MMDSNFAALQQLHSNLRVAIYCRLSKDDNLDGESASIHNQRDMLETWCQEHGYPALVQLDFKTGKGEDGACDWLHIFKTDFI